MFKYAEIASSGNDFRYAYILALPLSCQLVYFSKQFCLSANRDYIPRLPWECFQFCDLLFCLHNGSL